MKIHRNLLGIFALCAAITATAVQAEEGCGSYGVNSHVGIHVDTNQPIAAFTTQLQAPSSAQATLCLSPSASGGIYYTALGGGMLTLVYDDHYVKLPGVDTSVIPAGTPLTVSYEPFEWTVTPFGATFIVGNARPIGRTRSMLQNKGLDGLLDGWPLGLEIDPTATPPDNDGDGFPDYRVTIN